MTSLQYVGSLRIATALCLLSLPAQLVGAEGDYNVVDRSEVLKAMRQHYGGYELTSTTNGAWLAEVVLSLARQAGSAIRTARRCLSGTRSGFGRFWRGLGRRRTLCRSTRC